MKAKLKFFTSYKDIFDSNKNNIIDIVVDYCCKNITKHIHIF
jgi:hypothetical protein